MTKKIQPILVITLVLTFLATVRTWFFFPFDFKILSVLLTLLIIVTAGGKLKIKNNAIVLCVLCVIGIFSQTRGNLNAYIGALLMISPFLVFCCLNIQTRIKFLSVVNKTVATIFSVSLVFWVIHLFGVPLPNFYMEFGEDYSYNNYFFFLDFVGFAGLESFFPRFYSVFIEPSVVGMLCALMIFFNGFNFKKWYNIVYLISLLMTFSLAGISLLVISLIPYLLYKNNGHQRWFYVGFLSILIFAGYYAIEKVSEESVLYQMIGSRLEWNEDTGMIAGYSRSGESVDVFIDQRFWKSDNVMFGFGPELPFDGVDFKVYLVKYGIIPILLFLLFIFYCYRSRKSKQGLWLFFLFFLIAYRGYTVMYWPGMLMLYLAGLDYLAYAKNMELDAWNAEV